jgi:sugar O-acyltransferase (sialic acid O-acetyltransferase NeuD family)
MPQRLVLYAIGSPLVADAEEACARAGIDVVAGVRNVDGTVFVSSAIRVVDAAKLDDEIRRHPVVVALFTPGHRRHAFDEAIAGGFGGAFTLIDPTAIIARSVEIGAGVFVNAGCVIGSGCRIDDRALVNRSASIGHHARIEAYASIGPGVVLAGSVRIGRGAVLGAGAIVLPEVTIGENVVVAAGSVVRADVAAHTMVAGNPSRVVREAIAGYKALSV